MYLDKELILSSLTKEDVIKICMALGSSYPKQDNNGNLIFQSICHGSDSWKLYYYCTDIDYKKHIFHCYSRCSDSFNIVELVIRANRTQGKTITWYKALYYIAKTTGKIFTGESKEETKTSVITDFNWINRLQQIKKNKKSIPNLSEISEKYSNHSEPFRCPNIVVQYIDLYVSTISRLLVMSPISSGTPNSFGTSKLINS